MKRRGRARRDMISCRDAAEIAELCAAAGFPHLVSACLESGASVAEVEAGLLGYRPEPPPPFEPVPREAAARWSTPAPDEADDHLARVRTLCALAGAPGRAVEMIERDLPTREVTRLLNLAAGLARPIDTAPFPALLGEACR